MNKQVVYIIIFILITIILIYLIYKISLSVLKKKSIVYKEIEKINSYYFFVNNIPKKVVINESLNSKKSVLKYDFTARTCYLIENNYNNLLIIIGDIYHNRKYLKLYNKEFLNTLNKIKGNRLKKFLERKLCYKIKLNPIINFKLKINVSYKKYTLTKIFNYDKLLILIKKLKDVKLRKEMKRRIIKVERLKLTDGLRYDILKRDNFKCKICGYSQEDGVKLHVDHIIPVSRGGKTEFDNLQTLCERCNLGKSNKI